MRRCCGGIDGGIHQVPVPYPPPVLLTAVEDVTWREAPVFRVLLTLRFGARV